jgi:hypothetical protein
VTASSTAPSSADAAGNPVTYVPTNVIDGNVETAWRTPGDGRGQWVTLIFDNPIDVVRIGLIPGSATTDPLTGATRFPQGWTITAVAIAPIRVCALGPSGMLTPSTPAPFSSRIASSVFHGLQPFGGRTSTVVTNSPLAILGAHLDHSSSGTRVNYSGFR